MKIKIKQEKVEILKRYLRYNISTFKRSSDTKALKSILKKLRK